MSTNIFQSIKNAISNLDPQEVRDQADRPIRIGLHAGTERTYRQMANFFAPPQISDHKRIELSRILFRASDLERYDLDFYSEDMLLPRDGFRFSPVNPDHAVREALQRRADLALPLARHIYPFRMPVVNKIISKISKENALFSVATAIPDIIPFLSLPWAIGEFASDTAFITANQFRMAFFLAAASDRPVGYREQKAEIASVLVGAFGWRAIARELVGHIPLGGGLLPKAAIAYAGTRVVGMSMERYYRIGYGFTRDERRVAYEQALVRGKTVATALLSAWKRRPADRPIAGAR
jgi:hypothetical protein